MFTGLIETVGEVTERRPRGDGLWFRVRAAGFAADLEEGESVAVDGVCQTAVRVEEEHFAFESVPATLARTTLGTLEVGRRVNLERSLAVGERLGGHLVQGHVDGTGTLGTVEAGEESVRLEVDLPEEVARVTIRGGSLAVDGVSLTVQELAGSVAELAIIPYTWSQTALSRLEVGDEVNLEADLVGKYVERLLEPYRPAGGTGEPERRARRRSDDGHEKVQ